MITIARRRDTFTIVILTVIIASSKDSRNSNNNNNRTVAWFHIMVNQRYPRLKRPQDPDSSNAAGNRPLIAAAANGDAEAVS